MSHISTREDRRWAKRCHRLFPVLVLLVAATGLRGAVLVIRAEQLERDPDAYRLIAENLREFGVFGSQAKSGLPAPTAFRPPLYPLLLATLAVENRVAADRVAAVHLVLGVLSVLLAWMLARQWQMGRWSYLVAALVACDPILLNQSTEVMTETLATFLVLICLVALTHLNNTRSLSAGFMAGLAFGLAALGRPTFLVWAGLATITIMLAYPRFRNVKLMVGVAVGCAVMMSPWVVRNQRTLGRPVLLTTHGGYTLLLGNNRFFYHHLRTGSWGTVWDAQELLPLLDSKEKDATEDNAASLDATPSNRGAMMPGYRRTTNAPHPEFARDRRLYGLAYQAIREDPVMFVYASAVRVARFWTPLPHRLSNDESPSRMLVRWCIGIWYSVVYLVAFVGLWSLRRRLLAPPWVWGLTCVVALTIVHTFYWSNMRMRAPVMPIIYLVFVVGLAEIARAIRCR